MDSSQSQLLYLCLAYKITMFWLWLCWFIEALIKPFFFLSIGHLVYSNMPELGTEFRNQYHTHDRKVVFFLCFFGKKRLFTVVSWHDRFDENWSDHLIISLVFSVLALVVWIRRYGCNVWLYAINFKQLKLFKRNELFVWNCCCHWFGGKEKAIDVSVLC